MSGEWARQDCVACACTFEFPGSRAGVFVGSRGFFRPVEVFISDVLSPRTLTPPCPECGCVQPDAVAKRKRLPHSAVGLTLLAVFIVVLINGGQAEQLGLSYATAGVLVAAGSLVGLVLHAVVAFADPNRHLEPNRRRASALVAAGRLDTVCGPDPTLTADPPPAVNRWAVPLLAVGGVGGLLALVPFGLLKVNGWPVSDATKPEVISPGDTVTVWFPDHIQAVNGYWNGQPQAVLVTSGSEKPIPAAAETKTWGDTISGKKVNNVKTRPWAKVPLPDDPSQAGATVEVRVEMAVVYPTAVGMGFVNEATTTTVTRSYVLAKPGASTTYRNSFWLVALGAGLVSITGFVQWGLAGGFRPIPTA